MQSVTSPDDLNIKDAVISIGNFDGVHLGHQMLLGAMQQEAQRLNKASIIITFFPPAKLFFSGEAFLSTPEEKRFLLSAFEPAAVVMIDFNEAYAQTSKDVFVQQIARLEPHTLIVGEDFRFGHKRAGSLNDLSKVSKRLEVFNLKHQGDSKVSSSRIRSLLKEGKVERVKSLLGRSYEASGTVIRGDQRGRTINFPTANIQTPERKALPLGVFAVRVKTQEGEQLTGMANVGLRPSYPNDPPALEVHLFDFEGDLYDQTLSVSFEHFIRSQRKFEGLEDLKGQLKKDEGAARACLSSD